MRHCRVPRSRCASQRRPPLPPPPPGVSTTGTPPASLPSTSKLTSKPRSCSVPSPRGATLESIEASAVTRRRRGAGQPGRAPPEYAQAAKALATEVSGPRRAREQRAGRGWQRTLAGTGARAVRRRRHFARSSSWCASRCLWHAQRCRGLRRQHAATRCSSRCVARACLAAARSSQRCRGRRQRRYRRAAVVRQPSLAGVRARRRRC